MTYARKIFVGNYKGGVGKTTSIYQIALHMVGLGKRVLLIDLDPQCSLSEICIERTETKRLDQLKDHESLNYIYDLWQQYKQFPSLSFQIELGPLVKQTPENIHFIPSNTFYSNGGLDDLALKLEGEFEDLLPMQHFFRISGIEENYDYILFDCPPSNNLITQGAFLVSDYYIIPSIIQTMSIRGVIHYIKTVENIFDRKCGKHKNKLLARSLFGEKPQLLGIFETLKKHSVENRPIINDLVHDLKEAKVETLLFTPAKEKYLFDTIIFHYEGIARATAAGEKRNDYATLTDEILDCIEMNS